MPLPLRGAMTQSPGSDCGVRRGRFWLAVVVLLVLYAAVRIVVWHRTVLVEDHDSIGYLSQIRAFLSLDLHQIFARNPDKTPFYPFFGALCALPGWSVEFAARFCSFLFSLLLFAVCGRLALELGGRLAALVALFFLSLSPSLVPFSFAVLTEPSYVATVYAGLLLFYLQHRRPTPRSAALVALMFGLAVLNRTEGILYLALMPMLQTLHGLASHSPGYDRGRLPGWAAAYIVVFCAVVAPQVWWVSRQMGGFALNGRQAWSVLLGRDLGGPAQDAKRAGLDFSTSQINVRAVQEDPVLRAKLTHEAQAEDYVKILAENAEGFERSVAPNIVGSIGYLLAALGLAVLCLQRRRFAAVVAVAFVTSALAAPLLYSMAVRHVLVVFPMTFVVAGVGAAGLAATIGGRVNRYLAGLLLVCLCGRWLFSRRPEWRAALSPPTFNREYDPTTLTAPAEIIRREVGPAPTHPTRLASRKAYLPYLVSGEHIELPFSDLPKLRRYLALNQADYLFLEHRLIGHFPFMAAFAGDTAPSGLTRLYRADSPTVGRLELYRVEPSAIAADSASAPP